MRRCADVSADRLPGAAGPRRSESGSRYRDELAVLRQTLSSVETGGDASPQQLAARLVAAQANLQESLARASRAHAEEIARLNASHEAAVAALSQTLRESEAAAKVLAADLSALAQARESADRYERAGRSLRTVLRGPRR